MDAETRALIQQFVHENINAFHANRLEGIKNLKLNKVLARKNPYLFRAKNLTTAADLVAALLEARLSSSEEGSFGGFLESLAIYVAENTGGGMKSAVKGLDIELVRDDVRYLITVKSGRNWGNADQRKKMRDNFTAALVVLRQNRNVGQLQPVEGICYGRFGSKRNPNGRVDRGNYIQLTGQSFWELVSGDATFYADMIDPLGHEAEAHAAKFEEEKAATHNRLTAEFIRDFCDPEFKIDWAKLVKFVSQTKNEPKVRQEENQDAGVLNPRL